ncbi:MAG: hypothetical protein IKZ98_14215 [Clostridia bacterium]|nr:hypothetical protein [Clostridia bacterium]
MKKLWCCVLVVLFFLQMSPAHAKRYVNSGDYLSSDDFLADIELGTTVTFNAFLFSTNPYVDEDTACLSFVLLPWSNYKGYPVGCVYATEEDLGGIYASTRKDEEEYHYVRIIGIADGEPKYGYFYVSIMDGQGSIELINPESKTYCLDEETDVEAFKKKAVNYLDKIEIKEGKVIKTDDSDPQLIGYRVYVSCGEFMIQFSTKEKKFFVDDRISGIGMYKSYNSDGMLTMDGSEITLLH